MTKAKKKQTKAKVRSKSVENISVELIRSEDYLASRCYSYLEDELDNSNTQLLAFKFIVTLPEDFVPDPEHKSFEIFLWKFLKLVGNKSIRVLFSYNDPESDQHCYEVNLMWGVQVLSEVDLKIKIAEMWSNKVDTLLKSHVPKESKAMIGQECKVISQKNTKNSDGEKTIIEKTYTLFHVV